MTNIDEFKDMWTTKISDYYISMFDDGGCLICHNNMAVIIEDDDIYIEVIRTMLKNHVRVIKYDRSTGFDIVVSSEEALQAFNSIPRKDVNVIIVWNKDIPITKQLMRLKKIYKEFSQKPIIHLYKMIDIKDSEWKFAKMSYQLARKLLEKAQYENLELKIEEILIK